MAQGGDGQGMAGQGGRRQGGVAVGALQLGLGATQGGLQVGVAQGGLKVGVAQGGLQGRVAERGLESCRYRQEARMPTLPVGAGLLSAHNREQRPDYEVATQCPPCSVPDSEAGTAHLGAARHHL